MPVNDTGNAKHIYTRTYKPQTCTLEPEHTYNTHTHTHNLWLTIVSWVLRFTPIIPQSKEQMYFHFLLHLLTKNKKWANKQTNKKKNSKTGKRLIKNQPVQQSNHAVCIKRKKSEKKKKESLTEKRVKRVTVHLTRTACTTSFLCAALILKSRLQLFSLPGFLALPDLLTLLESCLLCLKAKK